jgi:four helix bundle protein
MYDVVKNFPKEESFRITNQLLRSVISIPNNIVEGCGRDGDKEFCRFLTISSGSASEVEYLLLLAKDLKYIEEDVYREVSDKVIHIRQMIYNYKKRIAQSS